MTSLPYRAAMFAAVSALALTACNRAEQFDRDPKTSELVVDSVTIPEVARIQVPMPAIMAEPPRTGSAKASLFSARQEPLFADQRAKKST